MTVTFLCVAVSVGDGDDDGIGVCGEQLTRIKTRTRNLRGYSLYIFI